MDYTHLITVEPNKRSGQPCVRGMRITVRDVLDYIAGGMTTDEMLADFPELTPEDVRVCLAYEERLLQAGYDDSPWTREEMEAMAWERIKHEDWSAYDDPEEKS